MYPQCLDCGDTITSAPPLVEESSQIKSSDYMCTNHKVAMVKIRSILKMILAVDFVAFYFTKTHILLYC